MKKIAFIALACGGLAMTYKHDGSKKRQPDNATAITTGCITPTICSQNLMDTIFADSAIATDTVSYGDTIAHGNFHDVKYGSGDCSGVGATTCEDSTSVLKYYAYYPKHFDTSGGCKLPLLVYFHGGGFLDCGGTFNDTNVVKLCRQFAQRGFVTFNVEYRRGTQLAPGTNIYSAQQLLANYRADQDGRGALRTVVRHAELRDTPYSIDTNKIFVGGQSAGSVIAMSIAYYSNQAMFDSVFPGVSSAKVLGTINQNFYYGKNTIKYKIREVLNMWGGLGIPPSYLNHPEDFFSQDDTLPPAISFQGHQDKTFADTFKVVIFANNASNGGNNYGRDSFCLIGDTAHYTLHPKGNNNADSYFLGEIRIYAMLRKLCKPSEYYLDSQMGHGLDTTKDPLKYKSDFGTGATNRVTTGIYMVQRACIFFQAILNGKVPLLKTTKFLECENYRIQCHLKDSNHGCSIGDSLICP